MYRDNEFTLRVRCPLFFEILAKEKTKKEDSVDVHLSVIITQENIPQQFYQEDVVVRLFHTYIEVTEVRQHVFFY